ncbi:MAG: SH3 domain-containing protein [Gallionella sp.]
MKYSLIVPSPPFPLSQRARGSVRRYARFTLTSFLNLLRVAALSLCAMTAAHAVDFVSVGEVSAILYDAPSLKARKLFVVNRYMPFEQVVNLNAWVKVRDHSGALYWVEKRVLSDKRYVFATSPLVDVRAAPDLGAARLFQVAQQVALALLESTGTGWLKVQYQDGEVGYVRSTDVWGD